MKIICTILGRGGSKGVKNKNIREIAGLPLIAWTINLAKTSGLFDTIAVSSDSNEILNVSEKYGADVLVKRPDALASDTAAKLPAIRHCVEYVEKIKDTKYDIVLDLDPTSPLRKLEDIIGCLELLKKSDATNIITASPARKSPYFNLVEVDEHGVVGLSKKPKGDIYRRQDAPKCYDMNASIYVWWRNYLFDNPSLWQDKTRLFVMPEERSVDIDTEIDYQLVELLLKKSFAESAE